VLAALAGPLFFLFFSSQIMYKLISELLGAIPGSQFYERRSYHIKQVS